MQLWRTLVNLMYDIINILLLVVHTPVATDRTFDHAVFKEFEGKESLI